MSAPMLKSSLPSGQYGDLFVTLTNLVHPIRGAYTPGDVIHTLGMIYLAQGEQIASGDVLRGNRREYTGRQLVRVGEWLCDHARYPDAVLEGAGG